jgi:hypothetical protein
MELRVTVSKFCEESANACRNKFVVRVERLMGANLLPVSPKRLQDRGELGRTREDQRRHY